jgi:hypothetical protein
VRRRAGRGKALLSRGVFFFRAAWGETVLGDRLSEIPWGPFPFLVKPVPGTVSFSGGGWRRQTSPGGSLAASINLCM